jgi:20S proteasome alpha/beta subunit
MAHATNNWGCDVTIGIAAFVSSFHEIVTISDARLSYGESIPADDTAVMKNRRIADKWGMMFPAEDSTAFTPVLDTVHEALKLTSNGQSSGVDFDFDVVSKTVQAAYEKEFNERFFREHLARFGYADVTDFRRNGFQEMGKDLYSKYADALAKFDLGLELLVYGYNGKDRRFLFEVSNPGKIISHTMRGYAAIGSGSLMATAALARKSITPGLAETIYRILDAKFSSETARDVGKKSNLITINSSGKVSAMSQGEIDKIREIWE